MHAVALRNKRRRTCSGPGACAGAADAEVRELAEWRERYLLAHKLAPEERRRKAATPPASAARYQPVPMVLLSRQVLMCSVVSGVVVCSLCSWSVLRSQWSLVELSILVGLCRSCRWALKREPVLLVRLCFPNSPQ